MSPFETIRSITIAAVLCIQFLQPAPAANSLEAPLLELDQVVFEGSRPAFDVDGDLVAVSRIHFSAVTAGGLEIEGSGELSLPGQNRAAGAPATIGIISDILGRLQEIPDGTSKTFTGSAQVDFASMTVDGSRFAASGRMQLRVQLLEPAPVREFDVEAEAVQGSDGRWRARFHGTDRLGLGVHVDGFFVPSNEWGIWDDIDIFQLDGAVEALGLLGAGADQGVFDDKSGAEQVYFVYGGPGRFDNIAASTTEAGRFAATLTLPITIIGHTDNTGDAYVYIREADGTVLNTVRIHEVDDIVLNASQSAPDGTVVGRADVVFSGVGERNGVEVTVSGTAEFHFQGDSAAGIDWFMAGGEFRVTNAALADAETGGALLYEDVSGRVGQAMLVGTIDPAGQVDLAGALGQVTLQ